MAKIQLKSDNINAPKVFLKYFIKAVNLFAKL